MSMSPATLIVTFLAILIFSIRLSKLVANYRSARATGLPIIVIPFSWQDPLWLLVGHRFHFLRRLPFGLGSWVEYSLTGWQLRDRYAIHAALGPAFILVSPGINEIMVADAAAGERVLSSYKDWIKGELYENFSIYGPNVLSANGRDWQRHRKIAAPAFREATNKLVWTEASRSAETRSKRWAGRAEIDLKDLAADNCSLVLGVFMAAGLGKPLGSVDGVKVDDNSQDSSNIRRDSSTLAVRDGHKMSYGGALRTLLENMVLAILCSKIKVPAWLAPANVQNIMTALQEFKQYTTDIITYERRDILGREAPKANLISALVHANEMAHEEDGAKMVLSDDELYGNMFILSLAGSETTATALTYALPLLAVNEDVQEWAASEARDVIGNEGIADYEHSFPRLVRIMAVMYETLRLWGSVQGLARYTGLNSQQLDLEGTQYQIPARTYVTVNLSAAHSNPKIWGEDALQWRPQRWIEQSPSGHDILSGPPEGAALLSWSWGPRICPGKKFSQVEFAAVLATMLARYRIVPARGGSESEAKAMLLNVIQDSGFNLSPKMREPTAAALKWVLRD